MGVISVSLPSDGSTADVADVNTPITTIVNEFNGNIDNANIKASAAIDPAKLANAIPNNKFFIPYKFSAYCSSSSALGASSFTKVAFNTKDFDTGSNYDNTTGYRFTAPVDGYYRFSAQVQITAAGVNDTYLITLYKNGADFKEGDKVLTGGSGTVQLGVHPPIFKLVTGDYIEVWVYNGTGGGKLVSAGSVLSYFGGELVSTT